MQKKMLEQHAAHAAAYRTARENLEKFGRKFKAPKEISVEKTEIAGVPVEWAVPPAAEKDRITLFLHGGGYCIGSAAAYRPFTVGLAGKSGVPVLSVEYRLAPENPFPAALHDVTAVYREMIDSGTDPRNILFLGDSAGGGLCVAAAMYFREHQIPLPGAIALLSPWMDLTMTTDSCIRNAALDPINSVEFDRLCAKAYAGETHLEHYLISPVYGDYENLPPLFIHGATEDVYSDDSVKTAERARAAGVDVTYKLWNGMFHDFMIFYRNTPEGKRSIQELVCFVREKLSVQSAGAPEPRESRE